MGIAGGGYRPRPGGGVMKSVMHQVPRDHAAYGLGKLDAMKIYSTIVGDQHRGYDLIVQDKDYDKAQEELKVVASDT